MSFLDESHTIRSMFTFHKRVFLMLHNRTKLPCLLYPIVGGTYRTLAGVEVTLLVHVYLIPANRRVSACSSLLKCIMTHRTVFSFRWGGKNCSPDTRSLQQRLPIVSLQGRLVFCLRCTQEKTHGLEL